MHSITSSQRSEVENIFHETLKHDAGINTCPICAAWIPKYATFCMNCLGHQGSSFSLADEVAVISYAIKDQQSYRDFIAYKHTDRSPQSERAKLRLRNLLKGTMDLNWPCIRGNQEFSSICVVPSSKKRPHLKELLDDVFRSSTPRLDITGVPTPRAVTHGDINIADDQRHLLKNVLVLEDLWVTGGSAQTVASALKDAGAERVIVLALAKLIVPTFGETTTLIQKLESTRFNWTNCPLHGNACTRSTIA